MAALAGVFVFLAIEGVPGFVQDEQFYKGAGSFWGYVDNLLFGTVLVVGDRPASSPYRSPSASPWSSATTRRGGSPGRSPT